MRKNILLIMPDFFSTKKDITEALIEKGYNVISFSDRPSNYNFIKGIIRINRRFVSFLTKKYCKLIYDRCKDIYFDRIIFINAQSFTKNHISFLLGKLKFGKSIFYMWDSISFLPYTKKILPLFDETITFDLNDFESGLFSCFLPLYISKLYRCDELMRKNEILYDLIFIGTGKPKKIPMIKEAIKFCNMNDICFYHRLYLPSKIAYYFNKLFFKEYKGMTKTDFHFTKLDQNDIIDLYAKSNCILDTGNPNEGGLPLRFFESAGLNIKIMTTNQSLKKYSFYNENNHFVIGDIFLFSNDFVRSKYIANFDYRIFYIENWVDLLVHPNSINHLSFIKKKEGND